MSYRIVKFFSFLLSLSAFSLKCYECSGTEATCSMSTLQGDKKYEKECSSGNDRCMRTYYHKDGNTAVGNSCTNQLDCTLSEEICNTWEESDDDVICKIGCCTSDLCNAGSPPSFSIFLVTVCSALGLALLM